MKHYELVLMVTPNQSDQVPAMIERYQKVITEGNGKVHRTEDWGRHQLEYLIDGVHKAHYILFNIEVSQKALDKLVSGFKFNDAILRHLIVNKKSADTEKSPMMLKVEAENASLSSKQAATEKPGEDAESTPASDEHTESKPTEGDA